MLCTDASDIGLGVLLMQERSRKPQPIVYASRLSTTAEKNSSITERFPVIYCLERFYGKFRLPSWTDYTAIQHLFKQKNLRGRLACDS